MKRFLSYFISNSNLSIWFFFSLHLTFFISKPDNYLAYHFNACNKTIFLAFHGSKVLKEVVKKK